ncbi:ATP-binding cassette domain-containing protein, partial [Parafrankia discariae]|uniref:ATP-binding cassette domain-containing protein n=1 Tax=Parafrankia discariae TaxID=365528 RepID=UPI000373B178
MDRTTLSVISPAGHNTLTGDAPCVVGRARGADIVINDARVSRRHLVLEPVAGGWQVRDTSANGLWQDGRRMGDTTVHSTEVRFRLGAADGPEVVLVPSPVGLAAGAAAGSVPAASAPAPAVPTGPPPRVAGAPGWPSSNATPGHAPAVPGRAPALGRAPVSGRTRPAAAAPAVPVPGRPAVPPASPVPAAQQPPPAGGSGTAGPTPPSTAPDLETAQSAIVHARRKLHPLRPGTLRLGRSRDNDISVSDLLASRHHAELLVAPGRVEVVDLGSANGTFLNGQRIGRAQVGQRDVIAIGHHLYQLEGDSLVEYVDSGDVAFEVQALSVFAGTKQLMHDMTFRLPGRSLLGVVGPSGAGKSTLLNALTGFRPADVGSVRYAGRDLYAEYDELRRRIGYVPQADPLHAQLTVREALEYGAELRFPADTTAQERRARVAEVIGELGLTAHSDTPVSRLSGGQKKRTSVALELLTRPSLLFLDEPTSGLDPANDQSVMET